jgi:hypothetical protein
MTLGRERNGLSRCLERARWSARKHFAKINQRGILREVGFVEGYLSAEPEVGDDSGTRDSG